MTAQTTRGDISESNRARMKYAPKRIFIALLCAHMCACAFLCARACVLCVVCDVCVCMIIVSPYRLRHWLRLNDDKRLYYPMQGSVGQLNL